MRWPSLLLTAAWLLSPAYAVFADDAYQNDYHIPLLGLPQPHTTFFHRPNANSKAALLYTLSEKAVLGAVNPKDGAVVWRQQLSGTANTSHLFLRAGDEQDIVVSAANDQVAAWGASDGRLAWSTKVGHGIAKDLEVLELPGATSASGVKDVLILSGGDYAVLQRLDGETGNVKWDGDTAFQVSASATDIFLVSLHSTLLGGLKINVASIDPGTGQRRSHYSLGTEGDIAAPSDILHVGANSAFPLIAWTDKAYKTLKVNVLGSKGVSTLAIHNGAEEVDSVTLHAPHRANALAHFLVHFQTSSHHWADVYHVDLTKLTVSRAYSLPKVAGRGAFSCSSVDANVFFTRVTDSETILVSSLSHGILERHTLAQAGQNKQPLHGVAEVASGSPSSRAVLLTDDGNWTMLRNGDTVWSRPEYLAHAVAATFAQLPQEQTLVYELEVESHQNAIAAFVHRLKRHMQSLENVPSLFKNPAQLLKGAADVTGGTDDTFGLVKIIVLALPHRRLVAFDTSSPGIPIWTSSIPGSNGLTDWVNVRLLPYDSGSVKVVEDGTSVPHIISIKTGQVVAEPDPAVSSEKLSSSSGLFKVEVNDHGLIGYSPDDSGSPAWHLRVSPSQHIVSVSSRIVGEPVASIGKALGDRRVLYKYLNPNLALLITVDDVTSDFTVTLLDTTSGQALQTSTLNGVDTSRPVVSVISENWFAYAYSVIGASQTASRGQQLVISELYESSLPDDRGPLESSSNYSSIGEELSSPSVLTRTFQIPEAILGMTVTQTKQGITSRDLLITLADSKGIVSIPRHVLDARRPVGRDPTKDEQAEGLARYAPTLDLSPQWYLNHQREILGIKEVITTPSLLESTSLVFAYGLDIFGTRVSPSFTFDILGKGFNKVQMLLTVAALGVAVVAVAPFVTRKQINQRWQMS